MEYVPENPDLAFSVKVVALGVSNLLRARFFYGETLGLPPAMEDGVQVGCRLKNCTLMFKENWYGKPTEAPNPRITLEVSNARDTERALHQLGVTISDPVEPFGNALVGAFLDSEGNKLWYCSAA
ncbi:MAG TPA: VOC family protein [Thiobacillaceae bacterium]|nr:VOC family protein [Thiobacillaceae bacterium]HNA83592.1 VOC family protein [Thiobacillaceae bacterium]HNF89210.1 VOC family protein [Thiobacillaceae bacterium]HNI08499.1 VOC family protein [Thiobacillaceae bacterium]